MQDSSLPSPNRTTTNIYAFAAGDFVKFGKADNVASRLNSIQTACPLKVRLIGSVQVYNASIAESKLRDWYRQELERGEWYAISPQEAFDALHEVHEMWGRGPRPKIPSPYRDPAAIRNTLIRRRRLVKKTAQEDTAEWDTLTTDQQKRVDAWIINYVEKQRGEVKHVYTTKHVFENSTEGFYVTVGQFAGAMMVAGFRPVRMQGDMSAFRHRVVGSGRW